MFKCKQLPFTVVLHGNLICKMALTLSNSSSLRSQEFLVGCYCCLVVDSKDILLLSSIKFLKESCLCVSRNLMLRLSARERIQPIASVHWEWKDDIGSF